MLKKFFVVLVSAFLVSAVLVGCGNGGGNQATPIAPPAPQETVSAVQQFLNDYAAEIEAEFEPIAGMLGEGSSIAIEAGEGEELVFVFTYGPDMPTEGLGAILDSMLPLLAPVFEDLAAELQVELGVDTLRLTVRYQTYGGEVLAEQSFDS